MFDFFKKAKDDYVDAYHRDGVALVKGVFRQEEMNALRSAAYMVLTRLDKIRENGYRHDAIETTAVAGAAVPSPALVFWPCLASEVLDGFRTDPRLRGIVKELLGPDVKELNNQLYYRLPGDGDTFAWHQDIMFRTPRSDYPGIVERNAYLQTAIIVDRMRKENGGIEYVLGSHKLGDLGLIPEHAFGELRGFDRQRNAERFRHLPTRIVEADPGDVLIWSSLIVHGSQSNRSEQHRMYYMNGFARAECAKPWPYYLKDGELAPLDPSLIP